ncbi:hypothetical protein [Paenibacillus lentus]|uniref:Tetratricopeptide repeat protein n=1 Tax=Paenibacillus lentus TaxID=1338368 RepID=A0A3Q8S568_9BACL|nr:hypothetical protein [Paenibacillus lentus]AZK47087.1 hypothetical protein EIM92_13750 [Paenibacillus lentus]
MNTSERCESFMQAATVPLPKYEQRLLQIGLNLHRSHTSDEDICNTLRDLIEQDKLPNGKNLLVSILYQLGAYHSAAALITPELLHEEPMRLKYAEALIHIGCVEQATAFIERCLKNTTQVDDAKLSNKMNQLFDICQLQIQGGSLPKNIPFSRLAAFIGQAVKYGLNELAFKLASSGDHYLQCLFIDALYREGYNIAAKNHLSRLPDPLSLGAQRIFQQAAFISAEMLHDDANYAEASHIFNALIQQAPDMAQARFGAASCYLHETITNLYRRIELYHPAEEARLKIDKYLDKIQQTLLVVNKSNWHTIWSPAQQRNLQHSRAVHLN